VRSKLYNRIKDSGGTYTFKEGMSALPRAIANNIPHTTTLTSTSVSALAFGDEGVIASLQEERTGVVWEERFDHVVSTVDANALANILSASPARSTTVAPTSAPFPLIDNSASPHLSPFEATKARDELVSLLRGVDYASVYTVNLGYVADVIPAQFRGFGMLVPSLEDVGVLGVAFDSHSFPTHDTEAYATRLTVMMGGT
jgi:protoporphyrinogen oxidase